MKKFIRMALVLALAGSALLYTGCTKDYSEDLKGLQGDVSTLKNDYSAVKTALENLGTQVSGLVTADANLQKQIDAANSNINSALGAIATLDQYAKKGYVDSEIGKLDEKFQALLDEELGEAEDYLLDKIGEIEEQVAALTGDFPELSESLEELSDAMALLNSMIQSLVFVPAIYNQPYDVEAIQYNLHTTPASTSDHIIVATFKVTPASAVEDVTIGTSVLTAFETKASASTTPKTLTITKIQPREDIPGYIDVFATAKRADYPTNGSFAMTLSVQKDLVDGGLKDDVTSDFVDVWCNPAAAALAYTVKNNVTGEVLSGDVDDDIVYVKVSQANDSLPIFTPGKWDVTVDLGGAALTMSEASEVSGKPAAAFAPLAADTTYNTATAPAHLVAANYKYTNTGKNKAFNSTIKPLVAKATLLTTDDYAKIGVKIGAWTVYGTYKIVPDTVYVSAEPRYGAVVIPWDFHSAPLAVATLPYRDTVEAIRVADADSVAGTAATTNTVKIYNKASNFQYDVTAADVLKENSVSVKAIIASNDLAFGKADSVYVFERNVQDNTTMKVYTSRFEFTVKGRPADTTIDFGTIPVEANFAAGLNIPVLPVKKAVEAHADAYHLNGVSADSILVAAAFNAAPVSGKSAKRGATVLAATAMTINATVATPVKDNSTIAVPVGEMAYGKITYTEKRTVYGIVYTYKAVLDITKPAAKLDKKVAYVLDDEDGVAPKSYKVEIKGDAPAPAYNYVLNTAEFADYLKVVDLKATTEPLQVDYSVITPRATTAPTLVTAGTTPVAVTLIPSTTQGNLASSIFNWAAYDSLEFSVRAKLAPVAAAAQILDSADVRLYTKDPIPYVASNDTTVKHAALSVASVDLAHALVVKDFRDSLLTGPTPSNPAKGLLAPGTASVWNYGQAVAFDGTKANWVLVSGGSNISEIDLSLAGSVLTLGANQGTIVTPIVVKIPVQLTYNLDQGLEAKNKFYVTVTFVEAD